ncbi:hypothetical protein [Streptomyces sp. NPDC059071]|uniref:hypothetical protein n=1 Tax=unclassified Streptomyces TaxID=2593676 RepID=UPI0036495A8D
MGSRKFLVPLSYEENKNMGIFKRGDKVKSTISGRHGKVKHVYDAGPEVEWIGGGTPQVHHPATVKPADPDEYFKAWQTDYDRDPGSGTTGRTSW